MLIPALYSLLSLTACGGEKSECSDGFVLGEDGNCYAAEGGDTDTDTDSDTDTDTDADTDTDTDTDPEGIDFDLSGGVTIRGMTVTENGKCNIAVWGASQIDESTGRPLDPEDMPLAGITVTCPLDENRVDWSASNVNSGTEASVYLAFFVDPDGDTATEDARITAYPDNPLAVENGGVYTGINFVVDAPPPEDTGTPAP